MKVPLLDLKAQYATIRDRVRPVVDAVMDSQYFILGPEVEAFEKELAAYVGAKHAVGCASGTDAILLALMALGVGPGDEVVTTPFTFFATAGCVSRVGATPVFVDIEPDTFNINPALVRKAITRRTKAILPVHLFGQCADMDPILDAAGDIPVIEDAAQSLSAEYKGRRSGVLGRVACFSFFPSKNLGGFGDGGAVTTNDSDLAARIATLRVHGGKQRYYHDEVGINSRLDALQAAVLRVKLPYLDAWSDQRAANARRYDEMLAGAKVVTPAAKAYGRHVFNQYTLRAADRDGLQKHLNAREIGNAIYYPVPLHLQKCYAGLGYAAGSFPEAERASREVLSIPVYPELTDQMARHVAASIREFTG
ncbi:MAG TPA: DegT/DnrJ/EryC1/StrS family aminotransferase [Planctomycetota bacterium]|nr:DegT/DnrJ/EryC1/StrS family aminotransferase [Planctomycetota bacterium]HRR80373.1 DegT/DnrJ/EryC1/StrS family aminotransferase [Planctomycetota bacterium]HRT96863.1 DegT/DnrJ/EryC1/StrS family aminotransferase [Planctomycetota bacterium]